jgi:hypothetical protein
VLGVGVDATHGSLVNRRTTTVVASAGAAVIIAPNLFIISRAI